MVAVLQVMLRIRQGELTRCLNPFCILPDLL